MVRGDFFLEASALEVQPEQPTLLWIDIAHFRSEDFSMLELEDALKRMVSAIEPLPAETIPLARAKDRVMAEDVHSPNDLPAFDNSAMDGYAVRASDVVAAGPGSPIALRLAGQVAAGAAPTTPVQPGSCVRVFTGSPIPHGADAVVMQEDVQSTPDRPDTVLVLDSVKPWENLRLSGEDVKSGALLLRSGERITARHLGLMSAVGLAQLSVHRRPRVGLLATGSELVSPGEPLGPGKIYESNRLALAPSFERAGAVVTIFPLVPDTLEGTREALKDAFAKCDGVVTSGGVSVGELDFVKRAFVEVGGTLDLWRIAIKPGKPFVFGSRGQQFLFGLPGNPVSALVTFLLLVRPALWRWQGLASFHPPATHCLLTETLVNHGDRRHFMRVRIDQDGHASPAGVQASHMLSSLALAQGLVDVPPKTTLSPGTRVKVLVFED